MDCAVVARLLKNIETVIRPALETHLFEQPTLLPAFLTFDVAGGTMIFWSIGDGEYEAMIPIDLAPP